MSHVHTYVVHHLNGEGDIEPPKALAGYYWRISVCEGEPSAPDDAPCGGWNSEGAFDPFPDFPRIGELLTEVLPGRLFV